MGRRRTVDSAAVEARVAEVLDGSPIEDDDDGTMAAARAAVDAGDDHWYGRLVAAAHDSVVGATDRDSAPAPGRDRDSAPVPDRDSAPVHDRDAVAAAATAVELVRGYCRLRADLLSALDSDGERGLALAPNRSTALLAGDYLHAAAFESLHSSPGSSTAACVEALTGALGSVRAAFAATCDGSASTRESGRSVVDGTAGCVGAAAATLGGVLAGVGDRDADALAETGRALATVHAADRLLDSERVATLVPAHAVDEASLRAQIDGHREDAVGALRSLPASLDAAELGALASRSGLSLSAER